MIKPVRLNKSAARRDMMIFPTRFAKKNKISAQNNDSEKLAK